MQHAVGYVSLQELNFINMWRQKWRKPARWSFPWNVYSLWKTFFYLWKAIIYIQFL